MKEYDVKKLSVEQRTNREGKNYTAIIAHLPNGKEVIVGVGGRTAYYLDLIANQK